VWWRCRTISVTATTHSTCRGLDQWPPAYPPAEQPVRAFGRWVAATTRPGATVLNVGGGCGRSGPLPMVRRRAGRLVTVDPSPRVRQDRAADERHQLTLEEYAVHHEAEFDVAFAVHVHDRVR
jgi:hypothetical protein